MPVMAQFPDNPLARLDFERRTLEEPGFRREAGPKTVRHVSVERRFGFINWSALPAHGLAAAIQGEIAFFRGRVDAFEWKTYAHDGPPGLAEALGQAGFVPGDPETALVADAARVAAEALTRPDGIEIREATTAADFAAVVSVESTVWATDRSALGVELADEKAANPDRLRVFIAFAAEMPVACAWVRLNRGSTFAGLWGGSTLTAWRGRGIYRHLLIRRAREAAAAGYPALYVDASPDSRSILERNGFVRLTETRPYLFTGFKGD